MADRAFDGDVEEQLGGISSSGTDEETDEHQLDESKSRSWGQGRTHRTNNDQTTFSGKSIRLPTQPRSGGDIHLEDQGGDADRKHQAQMRFNAHHMRPSADRMQLISLDTVQIRTDHMRSDHMQITCSSAHITCSSAQMRFRSRRMQLRSDHIPLCSYHMQLSTDEIQFTSHTTQRRSHAHITCSST